MEQEPLLRNSSSNEEIFSTNTSTAVEPEEDHTEAISFCGALRIPVSDLLFSVLHPQLLVREYKVLFLRD